MSDAMSSGWPGRPSGCVSLERSRNAAYCVSPMPERRWRLVTVTPGFTEFTRTPAVALAGLRRLRHVRIVAADDENRRPFAAERLGGRPPDAAGRACHDDASSVKWHG